jgi:hypothetical protein
MGLGKNCRRAPNCGRYSAIPSTLARSCNEVRHLKSSISFTKSDHPSISSPHATTLSAVSLLLSCPLHPSVHIYPTATPSSCRTRPTPQRLSDSLGSNLAVTLVQSRGFVPTDSATHCCGNISRDSRKGNDSVLNIPPRFPSPFRGIQPVWGIQESGAVGLRSLACPRGDFS